MSNTIQSNFEAWLAHFGITGVVDAVLPASELAQHPDRVYVFDTGGNLLAYAMAKGTAFHRDDNLFARRIEEALHGHSLINSLREPASPGLQICMHRGWDADTKKEYTLLECDFDLHQPVNLIEFLKHQGECTTNTVEHCKTDQDTVAAGLIRRGVIKSTPEAVTA